MTAESAEPGETRARDRVEQLRPVVVAIDGPAGSGKSSVSREAARRLGYDLLDTGAAYRALAWLALEHDVDLDDPAAIVALLDDFPYRTQAVEAGPTTVRVGERDVTREIRAPRVSAAVSGVARIPEVRQALNAAFRRLIAETPVAGVVVEGRDITTVVAPDAQVRILLTADEEVRIARRARELGGDAASAAQLRERDRKDVQVVDFMTAAEGVEVIDSTELDFEQTVEAVLALVRKAQATHALR